MSVVLILIRALIVAAWIVLLTRVLASWIDPGYERPVSRSVYRLTEPVLAPIREALPRTGRIDLSPLIVLIGLSLLTRLVLPL